MVDSGQFKFRTILLQGTILLGVCVAVFLPWQLYIFNAFPAEASWEVSFNFKHFTEVLDERTGPFWYFLDIIRINYGDLIYLPLIWFLWMIFKNPKDLKRWAILIWFLVPLIFFSIAKTKMQAYILFTCPALFLMTADFFSMIVQYKTDRKHKWVFSILLILLIALPARYTIERMKPFEIRERTPEWVVKLKELNSRTIEKGVLFNYDLPIEAMFYTDLTAYSEIPEKTKIIGLMEEGYTVLLNDDGTLPEELKSLEGVVCVRL
jgi:4-amino-4-deoxy-L-arabinose transferase